MAGTKRMGAMLAVPVVLALLALGVGAHAADEAAGRIERIEVDGDGSAAKIVVVLSRPLAYDVKVLDGDPAKQSARRLVLDFANATLAPAAAKPIEGGNGLLRQIRPGQFNARTARVVLDLGSATTHSVSALETPPTVTIALAGPAAVGTTAPAAPDAPKPLDTTTGSAPPPPAPAAAAPVPAPPPAAAAPEPAPPATTVASDPPKRPGRTIPIRARGRRPYSLLYAR